MAASSNEAQVDLSSRDQDKENIRVGKAGESTVFIEQTNTVDDGQEMRSETLSPRRMKDIHLDGTVDDMRNVDPYMLDDGDLDIRSDIGGVAGSVSSLLSGRSLSVKSNTSSRRHKIKSAGAPLPRSNAGSRARQLKDHEGSPFLTVGSPQDCNAFSPEIIQGKKSRSPFKGSRHSSLLSVSTAGLTSNSIRSSVELSARSHRAKLFSSNSMLPPSKRPTEANHNIKMPFKHNVKKPDMNVSLNNPSAAMKDRTAIATHTINKLLLAQKPAHTTSIQGRLLKARLKPLEPVTMTTPTIQQCRGIVSETRQYSQSESRTFQRWKSIMAGNRQIPAKNASDFTRDGASTTESVHQTSEASTPEPLVDFTIGAYDLVDGVGGVFDDDGDDADWAAQLDGIDHSGHLLSSSTRMPPSVEPPQPFSLPNSRCAPAHCNEELSRLIGPAMTPIPVTSEGKGEIKTTTEMLPSSAILPGQFVGQEAVPRTDDRTTVDEVTASGGLGMSDIVVETTTIASSSGIVDEPQNTGVTQQAAGLTKRPHSAVYHQESNTALKEYKLAVRPRTAVDGSRKAVRFADESNENSSDGRQGSMDRDSLGISSEDGGRVKKQGGSKDRKGVGKSSCRPRSLDSGFDDKDDKDDNDGVRGGGSNGRVFLTQGFRGNSSSGGGGNGQGNLQQSKGGKMSAQGNNGKRSSPLGTSNNSGNSKNVSISKSSNIADDKNQSTMSTLSENGIDAKNPVKSSSSCLSATVFYAHADEKPRSNGIQKNQKPVLTSQKVLDNKKAVTPRKNSKVNTATPANTTTLTSNKDITSEMEDENNGGESVSLKSPLCKQESSDSGISDSVKDEPSSHNVFIESQHAPNPPNTATKSQLIRPSSSSMKRMKAYKTLAAKSKRGNVRPYSGSVYCDVEIQDRKMTNKARKDTRPASAFNNAPCSDISHIQGKYGFYAGAKTGKITTQKSQVSSACSNSSKSGKGDEQRNCNSIARTSKSIAYSVEDESQFSNDNLLQIEKMHGELDSSNLSLRPKSSSKVTFADENEYEDDRSSRKSIATSAKSHTSSILRGSATGYSHHSKKDMVLSGEMVDDIDYDQMWAELPDDNSDVEKSLKDDNDDDDDSGDDFMSKFDMLENQFNVVAAQFQAEKTKLCVKEVALSPAIQSSQLVIPEPSNGQNEIEASSSPTFTKTLGTLSNDQSSFENEHCGDVFVSEEEMAAIRESGYRLESNNNIFVADSSGFENDNQTIDANNNNRGEDSFVGYDDYSDKKLSYRKHGEKASAPRTEFLQFEEPVWKENGWVGAEISQNLYKSTKRYIEVKQKGKDSVSNLPNFSNKDSKKSTLSITSRVNHGQKKHMNSKEDQKGSRKYSNDDEESLNSEYRKPVYKMEQDTRNSNSKPSSVHIVIPSIDDYGFDFSCKGTAKVKSHRALSARAATPVAARKFSKDKKGNDSDQTGFNREKMEGSDALCIAANSCNIDHRATVNPLPKELTGSCSIRRDKNSENTSDFNSSTPARASSSSISSKESEDAMTAKEAKEKTNNYYELLLAYRSHCMEDSDGDDENENDKNNTNDNDDYEKMHDAVNASGKDGKQLTTLTEEQVCHDSSEKEIVDLPKQNSGKTVDEVKVQVNDVRPISAVTTDSGVESDTPAEEEVGADINLHQSNDSSSVPGGGSQKQLLSRPDSGVMSDASMERRASSQSEPLEIVAYSKNLTKQRPSSASESAVRHSSESMEKLCQLPPLCFQLNARPPSGYLYYFAYGPNMNSDRIACYLGCEKSPPRFWSLLFGFGMAFNMKGTSSNSEQAGGLPNLQWDPALSVEGCVYQITQEQLVKLDKFVGYPKIVEHVVLPVWMTNSLDPDSLGVAQYCVPALTYIARDEFTWTDPVPPSDYSVSQCIKSADLVTPEFKSHLVSMSKANQLALVAVS